MKKISKRELQLEKENEALKEELARIYNSDAMKVLRRYYCARDYIFPLNSKRRFVAKLIKKALFNPSVYYNALSLDNIKKLNYYLKTEDISVVENRLDSYDEKFKDCTPMQLELLDLPKSESDYQILDFPKFDNPTVSIIIPVYNQFEYTYTCLKSILDNSKEITYEIIIADDVSTDKTKEISNLVKNITVIRNEKNLRFLLNCNNAAKYAKGKYIHFLNNDTQVQEGWLSSLVRLIESNDNIGLVGSKLVYPNGQLQEAGGILWNDGRAWNYGNGENPELPEFNYVKEVDYISGASILIRADLWKRLGGFDELFVPAYCEDSDLAFSVRKAGYKVLYQPKSLVVHFEGVSNGTDLSTGLKAYQVANTKKFYKKWRNKLVEENFQYGTNLFLARDRSRKKKSIVFIDHYVPMYDKDAGSRTVFQYLKLLAGADYNIKFIGDNFFPHQPYTDELEQMGIEVLYGTYYQKNWKKWFLKNNKFINYIFLNRPHISIKYIDFLRDNLYAKIAYYGHDLHFLRELREYNLTHENTLKKSSDSWKDKELYLMNKSDISFYPSCIEVKDIKTIDPKINVHVLSAYIYPKIKLLPWDKNRKNLMFIGGFNHKPNIDAIIWFHDNIWPKIKSMIPNIKVFILGSNPPDVIKNMNNKDFVVVGYVDDNTLAKYYKETRMAIVPLRYGAGIKGKVIEAMANQIPIITTSVGAEGINDKDKIFYIADDEEAFTEGVFELYKNDDKLQLYVKNSLSVIDEYFSQNAAKRSLSLFLNEI